MTLKVKKKTFDTEKEFLAEYNLKTTLVRCGEFYKIFHVYLAIQKLQKRIDSLEKEILELKNA